MGQHFKQAEYPSSHPTNSFKALEEKDSSYLEDAYLRFGKHTYRYGSDRCIGELWSGRVNGSKVSTPFRPGFVALFCACCVVVCTRGMCDR